MLKRLLALKIVLALKQLLLFRVKDFNVVSTFDKEHEYQKLFAKLRFMNHSLKTTQQVFETEIHKFQFQKKLPAINFQHQQQA